MAIFLGTHEGIWDAFSFDISDVLRIGKNEIRVEVIKPGYAESDPYPLRQVLSGFVPDVLATFGGIWDRAHVETAAEFLVERHYASGGCDGNASVALELDCANEEKISWRLEIIDAENHITADFSGDEEAKAGKHSISKAFLWRIRDCGPTGSHIFIVIAGPCAAENRNPKSKESSLSGHSAPKKIS